MKILMVCLGNICRSPLAEGILKHKVKQAGLNWQVDSAGTNGFHTGEAPHKFSQKIAKLNGIDISGQAARDFTINDFDKYDKIYVMAAEVIDEMKAMAGKKYNDGKVTLLMNEVNEGADEDIKDPWYGPESGYHTTFEMIDKATDAIIKKYGGAGKE